MEYPTHFGIVHNDITPWNILVRPNCVGIRCLLHLGKFISTYHCEDTLLRHDKLGMKCPSQLHRVLSNITPFSYIKRHVKYAVKCPSHQGKLCTTYIWLIMVMS